MHSIWLCLTGSLAAGWRNAVRQFVPMNDEMLDHLESLPGPLVPYQCGVPCWHQMRIEVLPASDPPRPAPLDGIRDTVAVTA